MAPRLVRGLALTTLPVCLALKLHSPLSEELHPLIALAAAAWPVALVQLRRILRSPPFVGYEGKRPLPVVLRVGSVVQAAATVLALLWLALHGGRSASFNNALEYAVQWNGVLLQALVIGKPKREAGAAKALPPSCLHALLRVACAAVSLKFGAAAASLLVRRLPSTCLAPLGLADARRLLAALCGGGGLVAVLLDSALTAALLRLHAAARWLAAEAGNFISRHPVGMGLARKRLHAGKGSSSSSGGGGGCSHWTTAAPLAKPLSPPSATSGREEPPAGPEHQGPQRQGPGRLRQWAESAAVAIRGRNEQLGGEGVPDGVPAAAARSRVPPRQAGRSAQRQRTALYKSPVQHVMAAIKLRTPPGVPYEPLAASMRSSVHRAVQGVLNSGYSTQVDCLPGCIEVILRLQYSGSPLLPPELGAALAALQSELRGRVDACAAAALPVDLPPAKGGSNREEREEQEEEREQQDQGSAAAVAPGLPQATAHTVIWVAHPTATDAARAAVATADEADPAAAGPHDCGSACAAHPYGAACPFTAAGSHGNGGGVRTLPVLVYMRPAVLTTATGSATADNADNAAAPVPEYKEASSGACRVEAKDTDCPTPTPPRPNVPGDGANSLTEELAVQQSGRRALRLPPYASFAASEEEWTVSWRA